jgi:xanthine dehydrogenase accessory factor
MDVYDALARARGRGQRVALVTVLAVEGEAPSHPGAKLVVGAHGIIAGSLGCSEFDTAGIEIASQALSAGEPVRRRKIFVEEHGQDRALELFAEVHDAEPAVLIFGSNPIGRALGEISLTMGRRAVLVAKGGDAAVAAGVEVKADDPGRYLLAAPPGPHDAVIITDHDAPWVEEVLRIALASEAFYVGMLGSHRHAPSAVRRLRDAGVPQRNLARLHAPVGLDIGSRSPGEIAVSIASEVLAVERGRAGGSMSVDWSLSGGASSSPATSGR